MPSSRSPRYRLDIGLPASQASRLSPADGPPSPGEPLVIAPRRPPTIVESFNFAIEGIIHVLRTQRNMRIHFAIAIGVLVAALAFDVSRLELIALLLAIAFVLIAEMVNTAIEAAVDVASTSFDPMAKLAKDIGAGAVLIAAVNAIAVGYLVFSGQVADESSRLLDKLSEAPAELTLVALVITTALVIAMKALSGRGSPLRGGWPSGPRGGGVRRLDGGDARPRRHRAPIPRIVARVDHGAASSPRPASKPASTRRSRSPPAACSARSSRSSSSRGSPRDRRRSSSPPPTRSPPARTRRTRTSRRLCRPLPRRPRHRGGQRRERRLPARRLRRADGVLARDRRGYRPGDFVAAASPPRRAAAAASGSPRWASSGSCSGTAAGSWR